MRIIQTTDLDQKWSGFGPEMNKDYQINRATRYIFIIAKNTNKNYSSLQFVQFFTNVKIIELNSNTPRQKPYVNYTYIVKVLLGFHVK
jgi:hypothetical protein